MTKLETLVPPVELCKLIPAGEFEDAAFAWHLTDMVGFVCRTSGCKQVSGKEWQIVQSNASRIIRARKRGELIFPAPTLQEVMVEIDDLGGWCPTAYRLQNQWTVDYQEDKEDGMNDVVEQADTDNPATAALKLWLKLKGIEDGK